MLLLAGILNVSAYTEKTKANKPVVAISNGINLFFYTMMPLCRIDLLFISLLRQRTCDILISCFGCVVEAPMLLLYLTKGPYPATMRVFLYQYSHVNYPLVCTSLFSFWISNS